MDLKPDQTPKIQFTYPATVNCENAMLTLPASELLSPFSTSSAPLKPGSWLIIPYLLAILGIAVLLWIDKANEGQEHG